VVSSRTKPDAGQADGWNGGSGYFAVASTVLSGAYGNSKLVISEYISSGSDSFHIVSDADVRVMAGLRVARTLSIMSFPHLA
jgi:hypothetical protein